MKQSGHGDEETESKTPDLRTTDEATAHARGNNVNYSIAIATSMFRLQSVLISGIAVSGAPSRVLKFKLKWSVAF